MNRLSRDADCQKQQTQRHGEKNEQNRQHAGQETEWKLCRQTESRMKKCRGRSDGWTRKQIKREKERDAAAKKNKKRKNKKSQHQQLLAWQIVKMPQFATRVFTHCHAPQY